MSDVLKVGNCSGFYGDRLSAMREMLEGGELDVVTGDYLAELTMLILGRDLMKDASLGYARTFATQVEQCLGLALEKGVRIVSNAGGLNPSGLLARLREVASGLGLSPKVAYVEGDNLMGADLGIEGKPLTANAYLGAFGIAAALRGGADIVVTGRVTDASLVVGPAIARFGWDRTMYDELAGAVVAGHIIECGTQATGGNFSGFLSLPRDASPLGFPLAEIHADGSSVISKHPGTGGAVTVDTVTAQLVYEVQSQLYLGPDVITDLGSIRLAQAAVDRVQVSGVVGLAPPAYTKVCVNELGGFRNQAELVLTGLDIDAKAEWVRVQLTTAMDPAPARVAWSLARTDHEDATTEEAASARLRVSVFDESPDKVGKAFTAPLIELALASYPGFTLTAPPAAGTPYGVYKAAYVEQTKVPHYVVHDDGTREDIAPPPGLDTLASLAARPSKSGEEPVVEQAAESGRVETPTRRVPLGLIAHARSGDKGGNANLGLWADTSAHGAERAIWLENNFTAALVRALVPEAADLRVDVFPLPNLGAVNVVIHGLLGEGVAASSRFDPQAKGLGEWVRSRHVDIPEALL